MRPATLRFTGLVHTHADMQCDIPQPDVWGDVKLDPSGKPIMAMLCDDNVALTHVMANDLVLHTTTLN